MTFKFEEKETTCLHIPEGMDSCITGVTHGVTPDWEGTGRVQWILVGEHRRIFLL